MPDDIADEELCSHETILALYKRAVAVLEGHEPPEYLRSPVEAAQALIRERNTPEMQQIIARARELHIDSECNIDIDDATLVYHNETDGYWVLGWCFVHDTELPKHLRGVDSDDDTDD